MKPVPSSCRTDAVSEPRTPLCFSLYLGSPWHQSVPHPAPPRQSSASAIPNCSVLAERCFDLLLLAALIYPADWHLPTHCSPLSPISLRPTAAKSWLCWSQRQKSHIPRKPQFHWSCYQDKQPEGWCPSDGQSACVLKCVFVHSPLASYDSIIKALIHFSVYYCVRFSSIITVSWLL